MLHHHLLTTELDINFRILFDMNEYWEHLLLIRQHYSRWPTHLGQVTHICVSKQTIIGSDNGLSPGWRQAIIWTNAGILSIWTLGTNFSEILGEIHSFSFLKIHRKMSSAKWCLFCLSLKELNGHKGLHFTSIYKNKTKYKHFFDENVLTMSKIDVPII